ncbi:MAG: SiaB family protein kinase [Salibacteraceae bacterium]
MSLATKKSAFNIVHETGRKIDSEQFLFACRGSFNSELTDNILFLTEGNLRELDSPKVAKKVYYLMVEGLQNITRHQYHDNTGSPFEGGLFIINRKDQAYSITYGNWVSKDVKLVLEENLSTIVAKDPAELKEYYLDILNNSGFSTKGGAGLGLIDMARKSSGKINFEFAPVGDGFFYYLNLNIAIDKTDYNEEVAVNYIQDAIALHKDMVSCNAQIIFKGLLHEENVNHLSNQIDTALNEEEESMGMSAVMTELLKNVAKHAYSRLNQNGKPGVFMLQKYEDRYAMYSGNFIEESKQEVVERTLKSINELSTSKLNTILHKNWEETQKSKSSGLMRLRKISGHDIAYEIKEMENDPPYFVLKIELN